ncbi:MAG: hypothetical protein RLN62_02620 [Rickettsiales bacterium]
MTSKLALSLIVILFSFDSLALDQSKALKPQKALKEQEAKQVYEESKKVATSLYPSIEALSGGGKGIDEVHNILQNKEGRANHQATELGDLATKGEIAKESSTNECSLEDCNVSQLMSTKAVNQREAKLEELGFRKNKEQFPEDTKAYLDKANHLLKEAANGVDSISGSYKDCKPIENEFSYKEKTTCDEYYDVKYDACDINQVVEIDPKYTYQCSKKREDRVKTCHDEITSITCKKAADCDNGGIIAASVKSDMKFVYNYPNLTIGTIQDNYWCGHCETVDRVTKFQIRNKEKISEFLLTEAGYDDHLMVKLNDNIIYIGPNGGNKLEVRNGHVDFGTGTDSCERGTNWRFGNLNKDLRPFLKEGENVLFMRTIVSGCGEGWIKIRAKQHCCKDWDVKRETKCNYEEDK